MKRQTLIILLIGCACSGRQASNDLTKTPADTVRETLASDFLTTDSKTEDTIFIHRKVTKDYYHAIYIDKNKDSKHFRELANFEFDKWQKESYQAAKDAINHEKPGSFKTQKTFDLPQNWLPLYKYNDNYYLYAPSDWGNAGRRIINNQEVIYWHMDGPYPVPLLAVNKSSDTKYILTTLNPFDHSTKPSQITIHIVDPLTKMAVFEFFNEPDDYRYQLYVPAAHAHDFDLIVNYCKEQKQTEYIFDKVDYEKILNSR
jgi:hypothetical protein